MLGPGINEKQAKVLKESLKQYQGSYEDILKLNKLGFSTADSMKIYHFYKDKINEVLDGNLYKIYYENINTYFIIIFSIIWNTFRLFTSVYT